MLITLCIISIVLHYIAFVVVIRSTRWLVWIFTRISCCRDYAEYYCRFDILRFAYPSTTLHTYLAASLYTKHAILTHCMNQVLTAFPPYRVLSNHQLQLLQTAVAAPRISHSLQSQSNPHTHLQPPQLVQDSAASHKRAPSHLNSRALLACR